jgi:hypothetical protein
MPVDAKASHNANFIRETFIQGVSDYGISVDYLKVCSVVADSASVNMTDNQQKRGLKTSLGGVYPCFCHIIATCIKWSLLDKGKDGHNHRAIPNIVVIYETIDALKSIVWYLALQLIF